ncbi:MAG: hypothetical protein GY868_03240 [Deltaproteobacteria bacterium]|nr:hypothetical protein [Deltaproteobacteria bacterium]
MKKTTCLVCSVMALMLLFTLPAQAIEEGKYCSKKQLQLACGKIESVLADMDSFKEKLLKMRADIKAGKKVSVQEAEYTMRKIDMMQPVMGDVSWESEWE